MSLLQPAALKNVCEIHKKSSRMGSMVMVWAFSFPSYAVLYVVGHFLQTHFEQCISHIKPGPSSCAIDVEFLKSRYLLELVDETVQSFF